MASGEKRSENPKKKFKHSPRKRTVLIVNDEWGTAKGGKSTVHRQIASTAVKAGLDVYVTALKADKEDREDAQEKEIKCILTPRVNPYLPDKKPNLNWLILHKSYFPHLKEEIPQLDLIIGHIPVTHDAALAIKREVFNDAKLCFFNHVIPEDTEMYKETGTPHSVQRKESDVLNAAANADFICSVGPRMKYHYDNKYRALDDFRHIEFIPRPDQKFST
ncbi:uncharacterized protein [Ptychodera flava]|uniref:uncharacterized protein isoform X2 n=1 Tax=Ptychodera flava TaxID=63121 RepID=UPI003969CD16